MQANHKPTATLAELIANAWDADASIVSVTLPYTIHEFGHLELKKK